MFEALTSHKRREACIKKATVLFIAPREDLLEK